MTKKDEQVETVGVRLRFASADLAAGQVVHVDPEQAAYLVDNGHASPA